MGRRLAALLWMAGGASAAVSLAPAAALGQPSGDEASYKLHMTNGVKLFQDKNYEAAIAEFRAAYKAKPKANPLINIALAEKAQFRYPSAIATLETALAMHGAEMDPHDQKAASNAIAEMKALLAYVTVKLTPPEATLIVDGEAQPEGAANKPVPLGPGTHKLEAHMEGYSQAEETVSVASGDKDKVVTLTLTADKGYVRIHGASATSALSIDEKPVGTGEWAGLVAPGPHVVSISDGGATSRVSVLVVTGRSIDVDPHGPMAILPPPRGPAAAPAASKVREPPIRGFYGLVAGSLFGALSHPIGFAATGRPVGGSAGIRAGYRPITPIGLELMYQFGEITASGSGIASKYSLASHRLGANIRFMSGGKKARFIIAVGAGVVFDSLSYVCSTGLDCSGTHGTTGYLNNEIGFELSFGKVLVGLTGQQVLGTLSDVNGSGAGAIVGASSSSFAAQVGGGLRIGYAAW